MSAFNIKASYATALLSPQEDHAVLPVSVTQIALKTLTLLTCGLPCLASCRSIAAFTALVTSRRRAFVSPTEAAGIIAGTIGSGLTSGRGDAATLDRASRVEAAGCWLSSSGDAGSCTSHYTFPMLPTSCPDAQESHKKHMNLT